LEKAYSLTLPPWYIKKTITFSNMLAGALRSHFTSRISRDPGEHRNTSKSKTKGLTRHSYFLKKVER
jgi:hypothetical protein